MWAAVLYYIYVFNLKLGSRSSTLWTVVAFGSLFVDVAMLQPLRIWLKWCVINSVASKDIREIVKGLQVRFSPIMKRRPGVMRDAHSLIQHFNPACRVARLFPHLPVSRFLMALNDSDVPYALRKSGGNLSVPKTWFQYIVINATITIPTAFIIWCTSLAPPLQDCVVDFIATLAFNVAMLVAYVFSLVDATVPLGIIFIFAGLVFLREFRITASEQMARRKIRNDREQQEELEKLDALYGSPAPMDKKTKPTAGGSPEQSPDSARSSSTLDSQQNLAPIAGSRFKQRPMSAVRETKEDSDEDSEEARTKKALEKEKQDDEVEVDIIGDFVKDMHSVEIFRSK